MEFYDVIIVGGGPAGLKCAEVLGKTDLRVLLLEKEELFGDKLCAGGITLKDMSVLPVPFLFTLDRKELGAFQRSLLNDTNVDVKTGSQVSGIEPGKVSLDLPPQGESMAVGCCCDPDLVNHMKLRDHFHQWLKERNIDPGSAKLESYPIAYGYSGVHFENVFLLGEAAGLASGFTGEGIYQSLVSGQEVAGMILNPEHDPVLLQEVLKYNRVVHRVWKIFRLAGPLKGILHELLVFLMNQKWIRDKINSGFSK